MLVGSILAIVSHACQRQAAAHANMVSFLRVHYFVLKKIRQKALRELEIEGEGDPDAMGGSSHTATHLDTCLSKSLLSPCKPHM